MQHELSDATSHRILTMFDALSVTKVPILQSYRCSVDITADVATSSKDSAVCPWPDVLTVSVR